MDSDKSSINTDESLPATPTDLSAASTDRTARFWQIYCKEADDYDKNFIRKNGDNIDGVLIFAGLFSAVSASFLVATQTALSPDPTDTTNALLMMLVHASNNTAFSNEELGIPVWNGPSPAILCSQVLGYAALSASLLAALGAVLGKQWLSNFARHHSGSLQDRGHRRQQKLDGLKTWGFEVFMGVLPTLIQLALLLFSASLSIGLWLLNPGVAAMIIAASAVGAMFYLYVTVASLLSPSCPYHTPVSSAINGIIGIVMESVEEITGYWEWKVSKRTRKQPEIGRGNKILAQITAVLSSLVLVTASAVLLTMLAILAPFVVFVAWVLGCAPRLKATMESYRSSFQFKTLKSNLNIFLSWLRSSASDARDFMCRSYLDPEPKTDNSFAHSIAWLLTTSSDPDNLMVAAEVVPEVTWSEPLHISVPTEHLYHMFIRSIPERGSTDDLALRLGKAFVIMLYLMPRQARSRVWTLALQRVTTESKNLHSDSDSDLHFIFTIVAKLLSLKLGLAKSASGVEFPEDKVVSQPLLSWLLQQLHGLLQLEHPNASLFLPEASRTFRHLEWSEQLRFKRKNEVQYYRTFEMYFNIVVGANVESIEAINDLIAQEFDKEQTDLFTRIFERLKATNPYQLPEIHEHLSVPLTVLSRLASISRLNQAFKDTVINHWILVAFAEAVGRANEMEGRIWEFASCLFNLAAAVDAFSSVETQLESPPGWQLPPMPAPARLNSKCFLPYLLNKVSPASPEQAAYALKVMLANADEHPDLASNPDFVTYILYATNPGQIYSLRDTGLNVLVAACQHLLHAQDTQSLTSLASQCDLARFVRRAFVHQEPPNMLKDLLSNSNDDFNAYLLNMLALHDPFNALLLKLQDEPHTIPERDVRDLEIALALSTNEGRKKLLYDYLDDWIARIGRGRPDDNLKPVMALPLTAVVGWLLRREGPLCASEDVSTALLRPGLEKLLFPAWGNPDVLENNPQMLRPLLDCTARWCATDMASGTDSGSSSGPLAPTTLRKLGQLLDQLRQGDRTLSADIKRALGNLSTDIKQRIDSRSRSGDDAQNERGKT